MGVSALLDDLAVGSVLLAACGYAVYALGPKALRLRMTTAGAHLLGRLPAAFGLRGIAARLARAKPKGGCGGCDDCGGAAQPAAPPSPEIRVPLAKIGRRR